MVSPVEPQVAVNVVALTGNQSDPAYVASCLAVPRDLIQAIIRIVGMAILLLG